ncbi:MAG: hypothetical protein KDD06_18275 [Phaeodactylibacter sp.]|nr:hypothetical protein [Phaeodactylibacter sp.]
MKRSPAFSTLAALFFLAAGTILRCWYYLDARSLFLDEANLALNISELPYHGFFAPLGYDQYAPPLFLVCSKGTTWLLGNHEWALRLWPLVGGIAMLLTFYHLTRKLQLAPAICWFPIAMLALSPFLLRFGTEFKQYSTDSALALLLIALALQLPPEKTTFRHFLLWPIAGGISLWFSMPAAFVLAGVGAYYLYGFIRLKNGKAVLAFCSVGIVWLLSFAVFYFSILKAGTQREVLLNYHAAYFFPLRLWEAEAWKQLGNILNGLLSPVLGFTAIGLATGSGLLAWGAYRLGKNNTGALLLAAVPIVASFAASAFQLFSLIPRVSLFLMPLFLLLAAYGASEVWLRSNLYLRVGLFALLVLEAAPFANSLGKLGHSTEIEDIKEVLIAIKETELDGPAYIDTEAVPAYRYYSRWHTGRQKYQLPDPVYLQWNTNLETLLREPPNQPHGFWLVFSHLVSDGPRIKMRRLRNTAAAVAGEKKKIERTGAAAYWFQ